MQPVTLYVDRLQVDSKGKIDWKKESFQSLKSTLSNLPEGKYKVFIQQVKKSSGWRYKFYFAHVLPMIVEYMNRYELNQIEDPLTGELLPIDCDTLHNYHKMIFNPKLIKNTLKKKDSKGNIPEYLTVPMTTTKMSDGDFINRYEEQIIATYANEYNLEFISRDEFRYYFNEGKDSRMIIELQLENQ